MSLKKTTVAEFNSVKKIIDFIKQNNNEYAFFNKKWYTEGSAVVSTSLKKSQKDK